MNIPKLNFQGSLSGASLLKCKQAFRQSACSRAFGHLASLTHQSVLTVQRKNCDPLVLGPALAMERIPVKENIQLMGFYILATNS